MPTCKKKRWFLPIAIFSGQIVANNCGVIVRQFDNRRRGRRWRPRPQKKRRVVIAVVILELIAQKIILGQRRHRRRDRRWHFCFRRRRFSRHRRCSCRHCRVAVVVVVCRFAVDCERRLRVAGAGVAMLGAQTTR